MTLLQESLKVFFTKNKQKIANSQITICMGNEGCDLDSFISSLIVSYAENVIHVVPMCKDVFISKGELIFVCNKYKINVDELIFLERPFGSFSQKAKKIGTYFLAGNEKHFLQEKEINLILTDHNEPIEEFKDFKIDIIIDHHPLSFEISSAKRIYIDIDVGSATTLVSKYLGNSLNKKVHCYNAKIEKKRTMLCAQLASLLLIPIIMDTKFLKKRTSVFDVIEYKKLKKMSCLKKKELKSDFKELKKARRNDYKYKTRIILQKDFKFYNSNGYSFGMSVIKYKFEKWIDREAEKITGLEKNKEGMALYLQLQTFKTDMGLDFYFVATKIKKVRTIIILDYPFIKTLPDELELHKIIYKGLIYYKIDVSMTRKVLMPKIMDILNSKVKFK